MIKLVDLNYYAHNDLSDPADVLELQKASIGFAHHFAILAHIQLIKHMSYEGERVVNGVQYVFFKRSNGSGQIPLRTHEYVRAQAPDIVLVQGLIFPLQVLFLRRKLGKDATIIVQHHGESPVNGIRKWLQKKADAQIDAYLFTSLSNADDWIAQKIISGKEKCHEVLEASTTFKQLDAASCKAKLDLSGNLNFLWVGRLIPGKDPVTVLKAFEKFAAIDPEAKLYMIYQTSEMLEDIRALIADSDALSRSVILKGSVPHDELETWFSAVDIFISGSHREGSGYALIEAMACGCIPVVTDIPSFRKITNDGTIGFLFPPGDEHALLNVLVRLNNTERKPISYAAVRHFENALSFKAIAESLYEVCMKVIQSEP